MIITPLLLHLIGTGGHLVRPVTGELNLIPDCTRCTGKSMNLEGGSDGPEVGADVKVSAGERVAVVASA